MIKCTHFVENAPTAPVGFSWFGDSAAEMRTDPGTFPGNELWFQSSPKNVRETAHGCAIRTTMCETCVISPLKYSTEWPLFVEIASLDITIIPRVPRPLYVLLAIPTRGINAH